MRHSYVTVLLIFLATAAGGCATHRSRADSRFESGEYVSAVWHYEEALSAGEPLGADSLLRLAAARWEMNDHEGAAKALEDAARAGSPAARAILAEGKEPPDVESARLLARQRPEAGWARALYAGALGRAGRWREAAEEYRAAFDAGVRGAVREAATYNIAVCLLRTGDFEAADTLMQEHRAIVARPLDGGELYLAGLAAYGVGEDARAERLWRGASPRLRERVRAVTGDETGAGR